MSRKQFITEMSSLSRVDQTEIAGRYATALIALERLHAMLDRDDKPAMQDDAEKAQNALDTLLSLTLAMVPKGAK